MNQALGEVGVHRLYWQWASPDFEECWSKWSSLTDLVDFLCGIGYPVADVRSTLLAVAKPSLTLTGQLAVELAWDTPESVYNAAAVLCEHGYGPLVCDLYRDRYSLSDVAGRFLEALHVDKTDADGGADVGCDAAGPEAAAASVAGEGPVEGGGGIDAAVPDQAPAS